MRVPHQAHLTSFPSSGNYRFGFFTAATKVPANHHSTSKGLSSLIFPTAFTGNKYVGNFKANLVQIAGSSRDAFGTRSSTFPHPHFVKN